MKISNCLSLTTPLQLLFTLLVVMVMMYAVVPRVCRQGPGLVGLDGRDIAVYNW